MATLVTGNIEFPANTDSLSGLTVYVRLESVGLMDMPAETITETTLRDVSYDGSALSFSLDGNIGDSPGPFNVQVHVSLQGSGNVQKGDYVTKRTHYVLKENNPDHITVKVEQV